VRAAAIHQRDLRAAALAEPIAQARRKLEAAGPSAHDDDPKGGYRNIPDHSALHLSHSSSVMAGSMSR
jgi:hypothetical protein